MACVRRRQFLAQAVALALTVTRLHGQTPFSAAELAGYRLVEAVFKRFAHATRLVGKIMRGDPRYERAPLITRDITVDGEAVEMATALQRRLDSEPALAAALFAADISSREYALFAISLFAAHLAHGFVSSGAMRRVPSGVATDNVAFVTAHQREIRALFVELRVE